jgi:hypothetical protein
MFSVCDAVRVSGFLASRYRKQNFNVLRSPTLFVFSVTEPETQTASGPLLNNYYRGLCSRAGIRALRSGGRAAALATQPEKNTTDVAGGGPQAVRPAMRIHHFQTTTKLRAPRACVESVASNSTKAGCSPRETVSTDTMRRASARGVRPASSGSVGGRDCISSAESRTAASDAAISGKPYRGSSAGKRSSAARSLDSRAGGSAPATLPQSPHARIMQIFLSILRGAHAMRARRVRPFCILKSARLRV